MNKKFSKRNLPSHFSIMEFIRSQYGEMEYFGYDDRDAVHIWNGTNGVVVIESTTSILAYRHGAIILNIATDYG